MGKRAVFALVSVALVIGACAAARTAHLPASRHHAQVNAAADARAAAAAPTLHAAPLPTNHCAGNSSRQLVLVSITEQHAWMCARGRIVYTTTVTTGMLGRDTATPTGHYRIQGLNRDTVLLPDNGERYRVRYWIPFDAPEFGFHDASWQHFPYGSAKYKTAGSHGCVHLPLKAITFLYHWAQVGAAVTIRA